MFDALVYNLNTGLHDFTGRHDTSLLDGIDPLIRHEFMELGRWGVR